MSNEVNATITRNLKDETKNRLTIVHPDASEFTFELGPLVHVQTDGQRLSFTVELKHSDQERERARFIRALSAF